MKPPVFCLCENKGANQLHGHRAADQCLCFRYIKSTIHVLPKAAISSLLSSYVAVEAGLCRTWSGTQKTGFFMTLIK